jgi:hypothetical protein
VYFDQSNAITLGKQMQTVALSSVINKPSIKFVFIVATPWKVADEITVSSVFKYEGKFLKLSACNGCNYF